MSGHQEYECTRCGFQWESLEPYNGCPECKYDAWERPKETTHPDLLARVKELEVALKNLDRENKALKSENDKLLESMLKSGKIVRSDTTTLDRYRMALEKCVVALKDAGWHKCGCPGHWREHAVNCPIGAVLSFIDTSTLERKDAL